MKKYLSLLLVLVMALTVFAGCANDKTETTPSTEATTEAATEPAVAIKDSLEVMTNIWNSYINNVAEDFQFPVAGGDVEHSVMDGAGEVIATNTEYLSNMLHVDASLHAQIDGAANLMHMMNANTFTAAAYHVVEGTDLAAFTKTLSEGIQGTQWICGFPQQLVVATVADSYVIAVYGNEDLIPMYKDQILAAYPQAEIVVEESLG